MQQHILHSSNLHCIYNKNNSVVGERHLQKMLVECRLGKQQLDSAAASHLHDGNSKSIDANSHAMAIRIIILMQCL